MLSDNAAEEYFPRSPVKFAHQPGLFRPIGQPRLGLVAAANFLRAWIATLIFLMADDALINKSCFMIAPAAGLGKSGNFRFLCQNFSYLDPYSLLTRIS